MSTTKENISEGLRLFSKYGNFDKSNSLFRKFVEEAVGSSSDFDWFFDRLGDHESRLVFEWALKFRTVAFLTQSRSEAERIVPPRISRHEWEQMILDADKLPEARYEKNLPADLVENFILDGYNLPGVCEVEEDDVVLDFGAFNGNSAIALGRRCKRGKVFAFEPNPSMHEILERNIAKSDLRNVEVVRAGVSDKAEVLKFKKNGAASRIDPNGDVEVDVVRIDSWVEGARLERVDFMKFDIEGFEQPALKAASSTIRYFRPKIAISIYHMFNDFSAIPRIIQDFGGWYKFYLRHNAIGGGEIVLFCAPA